MEYVFKHDDHDIDDDNLDIHETPIIHIKTIIFMIILTLDNHASQENHDKFDNHGVSKEYSTVCNFILMIMKITLNIEDFDDNHDNHDNHEHHYHDNHDNDVQVCKEGGAFCDRVQVGQVASH